MNRKWIVLFVLVSLLLGSFSQSVFAQGSSPILVVNTSFLNVRTADGPQFGVVATVAGGTELPVLGTNGNNTWYLVSTPLGPGWVDVSFTLPRGDFSNVPVVKPASGTPLSSGGPYTIALYPPLPGTSNTSPTGLRATLNVQSVNLRSVAADNGPIIVTLYKDNNVDFPINGYTYDSRGVQWVSITVPKVGAGWIEAPKILVQYPSGTSSSTTSSSSASAQPAVPQGAPHVVVNTSYQNIRFGPGAQFVVIAVVPGGTSLEAIGVTEDASWYLVRGSFGQGWISSEFVLFRGTFSSVPVIHGAF